MTGGAYHPGFQQSSLECRTALYTVLTFDTLFSDYSLSSSHLQMTVFLDVAPCSLVTLMMKAVSMLEI
jgi:hypothetical protein